VLVVLVAHPTQLRVVWVFLVIRHDLVVLSVSVAVLVVLIMKPVLSRIVGKTVVLVAVQASIP